MIPICGNLASREKTSREDLLLLLPVARGHQPAATTAVLRKKVVLGSRCSVATALWACDEPREQCPGHLLLTVPRLCRVRLPATPWTAAYQAPPSMGFSRQEYWSGVPLPSPRSLAMVSFHRCTNWQSEGLVMDREDWRAAIHGVAKSRTRLRD